MKVSVGVGSWVRVDVTEEVERRQELSSARSGGDGDGLMSKAVREERGSGVRGCYWGRSGRQPGKEGGSKGDTGGEKERCGSLWLKIRGRGRGDRRVWVLVGSVE